MPLPPLYGHEGIRNRLAGAVASGRLPQGLLLRKLALTPAMGPRKVFVIGDAERLVPQTGAEAAANALLKALEEPPADTVFVLTTAEPDALLPTIRSRVVRVRVARLADSVVTAFAQRELDLAKEPSLSQRVTAAEGCIGRLLAEGGVERGEGGERFLHAVRSGPVGRLSFALGLQPFQARGAFTAMLDELLARLRSEARAGKESAKVVSAIARVLDARELAQGNVNPQLVAAVLGEDLGSPR